MAGRPGFFGIRQNGGFDPDSADFGVAQGPFDPIWGTLGPPTAEAHPVDPWDVPSEELAGAVSEVEVFGNGFELSGRIRTGTFNRLSDWLNMQSGFIQLQAAHIVHLGHANLPDPDHQQGDMWVRLDQVVLVGERSAIRNGGANGMVVQKQKRRATIILPGYSMRGSLHVHAHGSMKQFLETPDPRFVPVTDVLVRWADDPEVVARFPLGLINREQMVSILEEPVAPSEDSGAVDSNEFARRVGAA